MFGFAFITTFTCGNTTHKHFSLPNATARGLLKELQLFLEATDWVPFCSTNNLQYRVCALVHGVPHTQQYF